MFLFTKNKKPDFDVSAHKEALAALILQYRIEERKSANTKVGNESSEPQAKCSIKSGADNHSGIKYSDRGGTEDNYNPEEVGSLLNNISSMKTADVISHMELRRDKTFVEEVQSIIRLNGYRDSKIYKAAGIDRRLFSHMMSNTKYKPSKDTAIALAFALRQNLEGAVKLLGRAGYSLSHSVSRDIAIEYCFREGIYDLNNINELLFKIGEKTLGR